MKGINLNFLAGILLILAILPGQMASAQNADKGKSNRKQDKGWEVLFDGAGMDKWRGKTQEQFPASGWKVENGLLFLESRAGDIVTREKYGNFELVFEFNLTEKSNSGIKYFVGELMNSETGKPYINGPEYQIIDDYNYPLGTGEEAALSSSGSLYLLYKPENKKLNPAGEWNSGRIVAKGKKVQHWLNGVKVVEYVRGSKDFLERKAKTKFKNDVNYGELKEGHILLTDHNDKVYFRNIKVRRL